MSLLTVWLYRLALACSGLRAGLTLAHVLQSPGRVSLNAGKWLAVQHTFYGGLTVLGGAAEVLRFLCDAGLAIAARTHRLLGTTAVVAAAAFAPTLVSYLVGNAPVNALGAQWAATALLADWERYHDTWEAAHAVSATAATLAFLTLLIAGAPAPSGHLKPGDRP